MSSAALSTTTEPYSLALEISHACRLRRKLTTQGDHFVINVWGVGYRLIDPDGVLHLMKSNGAAEAVA